MLADRVSRKTIMLSGDLLRAAVIGSIPVVAAAGLLTLAQMYVVVCVTGVTTVFTDVARQSVLPALVPAQRFASANAQFATAQSAARLSGPALAGVLIALAGAATAMIADAVSYLVSALLLCGLPVSRVAMPQAVSGPARAQVMAGLRYAFGSGRLCGLTCLVAWSNFVAALGGVALVLRLAGDLRMPAAQIGMCYTSGAAGGLVGGIVVRHLMSRRVSVGRLLMGSAVLTTAGSCVIAMTGPGWREWLAAAGLLSCGLSVAVTGVIQMTVRLRLTPPELNGRVTGGIRLVVTGSVAAGCVAGGQLAGKGSAVWVLWLAAALSGGSVLFLLRSPLRHECGEAAADLGGARISDLGEDRLRPRPEPACQAMACRPYRAAWLTAAVRREGTEAP
jgi:MFS family permease